MHISLYIHGLTLSALNGSIYLQHSYQELPIQRLHANTQSLVFAEAVL